MEEIQSSETPPLFDNIDFNTSDQDYEIFESAVQQVTFLYVESCHERRCCPFQNKGPLQVLSSVEISIFL